MSVHYTIYLAAPIELAAALELLFKGIGRVPALELSDRGAVHGYAPDFQATAFKASPKRQEFVNISFGISPQVVIVVGTPSMGSTSELTFQNLITGTAYLMSELTEDIALVIEHIVIMIKRSGKITLNSEKYIKWTPEHLKLIGVTFRIAEIPSSD